MDKVTLMPCPFCGGEAEIHFVTGESRHFWAGCWQHCRVYASRYAKEGSTDTAARLAAITAWNTRATPAPDSGERMRKALEPFAGVAVGEVWKHFSAENPTLRISSSDGSRHLTFVSAEWFERARAALQEPAR